MTENILGQRFSHTYLTKGAPEKDSKKARFRLAKLCEKSCPPPSFGRYGDAFDYNKNAQDAIEQELGICFSSASQSGTLFPRWDWYFNRITVLEMLDTITVVGNSLHRQYIQSSRRELFISGARKILKEENLAYEIDGSGSIHPLIDSAFSSTMQSAIVALNEPRYAATAQTLEQVDSCLLQDPPNYIGAIRASFGACENLFKLMYKVLKLDARAAGDKIGKDQQAFYSGHPVLNAASAKTLEGFKDWVNAAHNYRHEQGVEEPNQPTEEVAILIISQGLSYVRWLAQIDKKKQNT
ncbi:MULTISPECIES: hypothetical protein [Leisingera]|jgi:hypothetical protein|uniref:hypothetical protein n=1 Tax=Leisingera TaxID=191028 RepID=UPI001150D88F|nr:MULTISPECIES: hypothetical protein [Leisingera]QDI74676.1 hypothetical protein R2C4_02435 [Leisingera aquaemixtae]